LEEKREAKRERSGNSVGEREREGGRERRGGSEREIFSERWRGRRESNGVERERKERER
jgi:hypothetical protein